MMAFGKHLNTLIVFQIVPAIYRHYFFDEYDSEARNAYETWHSPQQSRGVR